MAIKVEKIEKGFSVKFPFELKDIFRESFPSAKWNAQEKRWEVGSRSGKRLNEWVELTEQAAIDKVKANEELEAALLKEEEKLEIKKRIKRVVEETEYANERIEAINKKTADLKELKAYLASITPLLEEAEERKLTAIETKQKEINDIKAMFDKAIDIAEVLDSQRTMQCTMNQVGSQARDAYNEARRKIAQAYKTMESLGIKSSGLASLADMNFNRPDRDDPSSVSLEDIFTPIKD